MISKFPVHGTGCLATYNFLASQRPAVILWENEIQTPADTTICKCFQNTSFMVTKMAAEFRKRTGWTTTFRRTIAPLDDVTLRVQSLYESMEWYLNAPQGIEIAPANEFRDFRRLNPPPASIFLKFSSFPKVYIMSTDAWDCITVLFRNVQPWYFRKMKFKHRRTQRFSNVFRIHHV